MINKTCIYCGSNDFELKSVFLSTRDCKDSKLLGIILAKNELYYIRVCLKCGHCDIFSAKILDKENNMCVKGK